MKTFTLVLELVIFVHIPESHVRKASSCINIHPLSVITLKMLGSPFRRSEISSILFKEALYVLVQDA